MLLVVVRISYIAYDWRWYGNDFREYQAVASQIPPRQVVSFINVKLYDREHTARRCDMYGPLLISLHGQASQLFAIPTAQPIKLSGKLLAGLSDLPKHIRSSPSATRDYNSAVLSRIAEQSHFDYVLLCNASDLQHAFPDGMSLVATRGRFTLLKVR